MRREEPLTAHQLVDNLELRLKKACRDYVEAVIRKHSLKEFYRQQATGGSAGDMVKAMGDMTSDMRYRIAKDDWLDAMLEMNAVSNALRELRVMTR